MSHTLLQAMKTKLSLCFALLALTSAQAQIFRSEAVHGAILGGIAGGIIGHNSGDLRHNGWHGAALGATAGLLIGQAIGDSRAERDYVRQGGYVYRSSPSVQVGIGYGRGYYGGGRWDRGHYGRFGHYGHGRHYRGHSDFGWSLSYGTGFGYYPGYGWGYPHLSYDDYYYRPARVMVQQPQPVVVQAPAQPVQQAQTAPQQVTIINNYYNSASPMSAANGLFGR